MRKVTTINLNNNAYQIDEDGFEALRAYLDGAERALANNPDRAEILADLEQAIADKCRLALGPHKTVVSAAEIERILKEMGPVEGAEGNAANTGAGAAPQSSNTAGIAGATRRMYRLHEGSMWAGVCNGLAAYLGMDVVWVRLIFVLMTLITGFGLLIYIAMIFIVPKAETVEEKTAAYGQPFNAQELVDRVKKKHEEFRGGRAQRRSMRHHAQWWAPAPSPTTPPGYAARVTGGLMLPVLTVLSAVWFTAMVMAFMTVLWSYGHFNSHGWPHGNWAHGASGWPHDLPRWVPLIAIVGAYALIAIPIGAARRASLYYANGGRLHGWADAWSGLLWVALVAVVLCAAWQFTPWFHDLLQQVLAGAQRTTFI